MKLFELWADYQTKLLDNFSVDFVGFIKICYLQQIKKCIKKSCGLSSIKRQLELLYKAKMIVLPVLRMNFYLRTEVSSVALV